MKYRFLEGELESYPGGKCTFLNDWNLIKIIEYEYLISQWFDKMIDLPKKSSLE